MSRVLPILAPALLLCATPLGAAPIPVKVAVVVTFEVGADRGDRPGEFQFWVERENWTQQIDVPGRRPSGPDRRQRHDRRRVRRDSARVQPDHGARAERPVRLLEDLLARQRHRGGQPGGRLDRERRLGALRDRRRRRLRDRRARGRRLLALCDRPDRLQGSEPEADVRGLGARNDGLSPESCACRMGLRPHEEHRDTRLGRDEGVPGPLRGASRTLRGPRSSCAARPSARAATGTGRR